MSEQKGDRPAGSGVVPDSAPAAPAIPQPTLRLWTPNGWSAYNPASDTSPEKKQFEKLYEDAEVAEVSVADARAILESVRKRAEGWRNGVAASLALSFATLAIKKPGDGVGGFEVGWRIAMTVGIALAIGLGFLGLWYLLRAAHGPSWLDMRLRDRGRAYDSARYLRRAFAASKDLGRGIGLWIASVAVFALIVGASWYLPPAT